MARPRRMPRSLPVRRSPAPDPGRAREFSLRGMVDRLEATNQALRLALAEIVEWYDTFDDPRSNFRFLTERDFERYRHLAKALPRVRRAG